MNALSIKLFGTFTVHRGQQPLGAFPTRTCKALFAYLVLHRDRLHSREQLLGVFWGERPEPVARKSLRTDLWRVRRMLEPPGTPSGTYLTLQDHCVGFNAATPHTIDVEEFDHRIAAVGNVPGAQLSLSECRLLRDAVQLYGGDLLEDVYDDWCVYERERLCFELRTALERLMRYHEEHEEWTEAIPYAQRLLAADPLLEHVHRDLMRFHNALGDRPSAIRQFRHCARLLRDELQVDPMPETLALHQEIQSGARPLDDAPPPAPVTQKATDDHVGRVLDKLFTIDQELGAARTALRWGIREVKRMRRPDAPSDGRVTPPG